MPRGPFVVLLVAVGLVLPALAFHPAPGQSVPSSCDACDEWNAPERPIRLHGNTYYVGTHGLGAILVTSPGGHVLLDGALPESADRIVASITTLGFRVEDVRLILNSHAHFDHAGGIAALQRASGAEVAASPWSATVLERGASVDGDPQHGTVPPFPRVEGVRVIEGEETLRVGPLALTAHFTPGHTPGGTSWSWRSCEDNGCLDIVYADSLTPMSAEGFRFLASPASTAFEDSFSLLERLRCDILLTPHPGASGFWDRAAAREAGRTDAWVDAGACARYAASARLQLQERLARERAGR